MCRNVSKKLQRTAAAWAKPEVVPPSQRRLVRDIWRLWQQTRRKRCNRSWRFSEALFQVLQQGSWVSLINCSQIRSVFLVSRKSHLKKKKSQVQKTRGKIMAPKSASCTRIEANNLRVVNYKEVDDLRAVSATSASGKAAPSPALRHGGKVWEWLPLTVWPSAANVY